MSTEHCIEIAGSLALGCRDNNAALSAEAAILSLFVVFCMVLFVEGCKRLFNWSKDDED